MTFKNEHLITEMQFDTGIDLKHDFIAIAEDRGNF